MIRLRRFRTSRALLPALFLLPLSCGGSAGPTGTTPSAVPAVASEPTASPSPLDPRAVAVDLTFTGALSGHARSAVPSECGRGDDAAGPHFQAVLTLALADGAHVVRLRWVNYAGPGTSQLGSTPTFVDVSAPNSTDPIAVGSYTSSTPVLTVGADERSGTLETDYLQLQPPRERPFDGVPLPPPPVLGHISGTWRCAR